jgi:hypothetical protein
VNFFNHVPFSRFQFGDTNRPRGASIQAALDQPYLNSREMIFLISRRTANLKSKKIENPF